MCHVARMYRLSLPPVIRQRQRSTVLWTFASGTYRPFLLSPLTFDSLQLRQVTNHVACACSMYLSQLDGHAATDSKFSRRVSRFFMVPYRRPLVSRVWQMDATIRRLVFKNFVFPETRDLFTLLQATPKAKSKRTNEKTSSSEINLLPKM